MGGNPSVCVGHVYCGKTAEWILQSRFLKDIQSLAMGNPFLSTCQDLIVLDTRGVMDEAVVVSLCQIHEFGQALHEEYVKTRLEKGTVPLWDTIKRNNRPSIRITERRKTKWDSEAK